MGWVDREVRVVKTESEANRLLDSPVRTQSFNRNRRWFLLTAVPSGDNPFIGPHYVMVLREYV
jgi:hypothetical protein